MKRSPLVAIAALAVLGAAGVWAFRALQPPYRLVRATITLPPDVSFSANPAQFALSPDGRHLALNLKSGDVVRIWDWPLDGADAGPIAGTDGVTSLPAWSPDSRHIAFVSDGLLRRMPVAGGAIQTICRFDPEGSFDWGEDETLLLAAGGLEPLRRVAADAGSTIRQITRLNPGERHRFPRFIVGQRRFFFFVQADPLREGVWQGSLDGGTALRLLPGAVTAAVAGDFIVYSQDQLVVAQRYDATAVELSGVPVTLADGVRRDEESKRLAYSVTAEPAAQPVLVYQRDSDGSLQMTRGWPGLLQGK